MNSGFECVHSLLDDAAAKWPDKVAVETRTRSVTYAELRNEAVFYAQWLRGMGVGRGERVVVEAENSVETVAIIFAVLAVGAAFCPVHPAAPAKQRAYIAEHSEASLTIFRHNEARVAESGSGTVPVPAATPGTDTNPQSAALSAFCPGLIPEDIACLVYTSGSTGRPKGVTCLHRQVLFAVRAIAHSLDYKPDDRVFVALPLSFDYGLYQIFLCLWSGATLLPADARAAGPALFKELASTRATVLPAVPPVLDNLAVLGRRQTGGLPALRLVTNTGAAVAPATIQNLRRSFPKLGVQLMYGLTECKRATICPPDADLSRPGTCGLPLRGTEIQVIDDDGVQVPTGVVGQIVVRGPHVMAGYWKDEQANADRYVLRHATMRELRTGDYGWLDAEGYLYCSGRKDDIFKQRGFRVSCTEIESAASALAGIHHAVLVPPEGKKPSVLFVCFDGDEFDVISRLRDELEEYKLPGRVIALASIPKTPNGKFDRKAMKQVAHGGNQLQEGAVS